MIILYFTKFRLYASTARLIVSLASQLAVQLHWINVASVGLHSFLCHGGFRFTLPPSPWKLNSPQPLIPGNAVLFLFMYIYNFIKQLRVLFFLCVRVVGHNAIIYVGIGVEESDGDIMICRSYCWPQETCFIVQRIPSSQTFFHCIYYSISFKKILYQVYLVRFSQSMYFTCHCNKHIIQYSISFKKFLYQVYLVRFSQHITFHVFCSSL